MVAREAILVTFVCVLTQPLYAERPRAGYSDIPITSEPPAEVPVCIPQLPGPQSEPVDRGTANATSLRRIVIYDSIANRDGAEILIAQLRTLGVSEDVIVETRNWTKLHCSALDHPSSR